LQLEDATVKHQYVADVGDFGKYGLLRALASVVEESIIRLTSGRRPAGCGSLGQYRNEATNEQEDRGQTSSGDPSRKAKNRAISKILGSAQD
jgi:hypothetical protein